MIRYAHTPALLAASVALALGTSAAAFEWQPAWSEGTYWVVQSPRMVDTADWVTGAAQPPVQDGSFLTRFHVTKLERNRGGGGTAKLEIRFKVDGQTEYEDTLDWFEMEVDLAAMRPRRLSWHGIHADGDPIEEVFEFDVDGTEGEPWRWPRIVPLTEGLTVAFPVFGGTATPGRYDLISRTRGDDPSKPNRVAYSQVVATVAGGTLVSVGRGETPATTVGLLFGSEAVPWPDVVTNVGGNPVVETGFLE
jgi:hypothetical protein